VSENGWGHGYRCCVDEWGAYFRWPSRGERWSPLAWLLLVPKLVLAAVAWVAVVGLILAAVFLPGAGVALLAEVVFGGTAFAWVGAVVVVASFLAMLTFVGGKLDLGM